MGRVILMMACVMAFLMVPSVVAADGSEKIVQVGDNLITRGTVERQLDMAVCFLKNRSPKIAADKLQRFRRQQLKPMSDQIFQRTVIATALSHSNVVVSSVAETEVREQLVRRIGAKGQKFDDLRAVAVSNGFGDEFDRQVREDILFRSYLMSTYSNRYFVTAADLARSRERIAKYNASAAATNKLIVAVGRRLISRIEQGESFAALADRYTEDKEHEPGGRIGDCDANDFPDDKHVWAALKLVSPGEITDLLPIEDGYAIYRVDKRNTSEDSSTGEPSLALSRIFLRRPYLIPDQTDEELMEELTESRHEKLRLKAYKDLRPSVNIHHFTK